MSDRIYPRANRIYPVPATARIYPVRPTESFFATPGGSKRVLLNETAYPFRSLALGSGVTINSAEHQSPAASAYTTITAGSHADIIEAARFVQYTPNTFGSGNWSLQLTDNSSNVQTYSVTVVTNVRAEPKRIQAITGAIVNPFAGASWGYTHSGVSAVKYSVSGAASVAKTAISRVPIASGYHSGADNASALQDTTTNFTEAGVVTGDDVVNVSDGSEAVVSGIVTATNSADTLSGTLAGGTSNVWNSGQIYKVHKDEDGSSGLIQRVKRFEYSPTATGTHLLTLYVTDASGAEYSDIVEVKV